MEAAAKPAATTAPWALWGKSGDYLSHVYGLFPIDSCGDPNRLTISD